MTDTYRLRQTANPVCTYRQQPASCSC